MRDDAVLKTGDIMSGNLSLDNNKITNLSRPTNGTDAANKKYIDDNFLGLNFNNLPVLS